MVLVHLVEFGVLWNSYRNLLVPTVCIYDMRHDNSEYTMCEVDENENEHKSRTTMIVSLFERILSTIRSLRAVGKDSAFMVSAISPLCGGRGV